MQHPVLGEVAVGGGLAMTACEVNISLYGRDERKGSSGQFLFGSRRTLQDLNR